MIGFNETKRLSGEIHWKRVYRMLTFASTVSGVLGFGWAIFSFFQQNALILALSLTTLAMAASNLYLVRKGKVRVASYVYIAVIYCILVASIVFIGVLHQFLMPLAVCAFLLMRDEHPIMRHGTPIACLITYSVLACLSMPIDSEYLLSSVIRGRAVWIDQISAALTLYICLQLAYEDVLKQSKLELELRDALIRKELLLLYQPQIHASGEVVGVEALVRWRHPTRGLVPPNDFIPIAEASGLMVPIGDWVLRTACAQIALWQDDPHLNKLTIAVNVSASQFAERQFVDRVIEILQQTGAVPAKLKLELTESMLVADIDEIVEKMTRLKQQAINLSLDDFGTGFSSLAYLRRLPLDQLKIDQSFVKNFLVSTEDASIAKTVIALGNDLGLEVIAEGVETHQHRKKLEDMGCHLFQGYLFSKPITSAEVEELALRIVKANSVKQSRPASVSSSAELESSPPMLAPSWWMQLDASSNA